MLLEQPLTSWTTIALLMGLIICKVGTAYMLVCQVLQHLYQYIKIIVLIMGFEINDIFL